MDKYQAIHDLWSSFGLTAYDENDVPDSAVMPYITYSATVDSIDYVVGLYASLWYRSTSWLEISQKANEIGDYLGLGGRVVPLDRGYAWFFKGNPFQQRMGDEDDSVRRIYLNVNCEFLTDE